MRPSALPVLIALLAAAPLPAAGLREDGEAKLAALVAGRSAGPEVRCLPRFGQTSPRSWNIDRIGVVYQLGGTRYVMRFQEACERFDQAASFSTITPANQLCAGDVATIQTRGPGPGQAILGSCIVGRFTPYRRAG